MEEITKNQEGKERDILFSKTIKAGQRLYYVDVKQNRKGEMYLSITESKKVFSGPADMPQVSYEKHKIFIYGEDFRKFRDSMEEAMRFVEENQGLPQPRTARTDDAPKADTTDEAFDDEIKIDLEF